jgi:hypothetical protein
LYLSALGLLPLSKLLQSTLIDQSPLSVLTSTVRFLMLPNSYGSTIGWQMLTHGASNMLLVNVPVTQDVFSYQFVMNTITKAWCRFTGWNASCWAEFNGDIYFASGLKVIKANIGANDSGHQLLVFVLRLIQARCKRPKGSYSRSTEFWVYWRSTVNYGPRC